MRVHFYFALLPFLSLGAAALPVPESYSPTHYDCKGVGVELGLDVGRMPGPGNVPGYILTIKEAHADNPLVAHGDELDVQDTIAGKLISVSTQFVPDYRTSHASVVLPRINLDAQLDKVSFETLLITTDKLTTWGGPDFVRGLVDRSKAVPLHCEASYPPLPGLPR